MSKPSDEAMERYACCDGQVLLLCDECGYLFCGKESYAKKEKHRCYACYSEGIK